MNVEVLFSLCLALPTFAAAQTTNRPMLPDYPCEQSDIGTICGIFAMSVGVTSRVYVKPIPNSPFTADVKVVSHVKMQDGTDRVATATEHIARASSGRIYDELRLPVPTGFKGTRLIRYFIYDPSSRLSIAVDPIHHEVRESTPYTPESITTASLPTQRQLKTLGITETDLGSQRMSGLEVYGVRKQGTMPARLSGTGKNIVVTDDCWYSPELATYMIVRHDDPRTGEYLASVTNVQHHEPPAETFAVPPEYKVVDETTEKPPKAKQ